MALKLKHCVIKGTTERFLQEQLALLGADFEQQFNQASATEQAAFYRFAEALGCFSRAPWLDQSGRPTNAVVGQKASTTLRKFLQEDETTRGFENVRLHIGEFEALFRDLPAGIQPNQELITFLGHSDNQFGVVQYPNLEMLLNLERGSQIELSDHGLIDKVTQPAHTGIFAKTVAHFDQLKRLNFSLDARRMPKRNMKEDALRRLYYYDFESTYQHQPPAYQDLAALYQQHGMDQMAFDQAVAVFDEAASKKTPHHVLGAPIVEKPSEEHQFTYEMLDKYDPHNALLGMLCTSCANVGGMTYGRDVAVASIVDPHVQNLVVRNRFGTIIGKGTIYIDFDQSRAVINDFELNVHYLTHQPTRAAAREAIFTTFMRGIDAIAKRYDELHPERPLERVTVGNGNNKLKAQCMRYKFAEPDDRTLVDVNFKDANKDMQYILYER